MLGHLAGATASDVDLGPILRKRLEIIGTVMRTRVSAERIALAQEFTARVLPLFSHGQLRPVVDRVLPMTELAEAHRVMERDESFGKVVLVWEG
jgi:NADPH:quinone reductase-like Zn-dependent oxidoreductase